MRFYVKEHRFYCGIDLHARSMYLCILNQNGEVVYHRDMRAEPKPFLATIASYRDDIVVCAECIFTWHWIADLCARENIPFVLGHALYMKAIHGGKSKNDRIDSRKIAGLFSGMIPMAYVFPRVQDFVSYARLVKCTREFTGKRHGSSNKKIGSMHLKWAFSGAAVLFLRNNPKGMAYKKRLERKHGKSKALTILSHKLGRAVYYMLKRGKAFD